MTAAEQDRLRASILAATRSRKELARFADWLLYRTMGLTECAICRHCWKLLVDIRLNYKGMSHV